jgi:hypothetical protein
MVSVLIDGAVYVPFTEVSALKQRIAELESTQKIPLVDQHYKVKCPFTGYGGSHYSKDEIYKVKSVVFTITQCPQSVRLQLLEIADFSNLELVPAYTPYKPNLHLKANFTSTSHCHPIHTGDIIVLKCPVSAFNGDWLAITTKGDVVLTQAELAQCTIHPTIFGVPQ